MPWIERKRQSGDVIEPRIPLDFSQEQHGHRLHLFDQQMSRPLKANPWNIKSDDDQLRSQTGNQSAEVPIIWSPIDFMAIAPQDRLHATAKPGLGQDHNALGRHARTN
jgi:hypothetical protein